MSESERDYPEADRTLSSDARWSTYEKAPDDDPGYPPRGGGVIQTKGTPSEESSTKTARTARSRTSSKEE